MKNIFAKTITTTAGTMKKAISDAINAALKAGVPHSQIRHELETHAADFRRAEEFRIEQRMRNPLPTQYDPISYQPIDAHAEAARREEKRNADELRRQQAEYARSVDERGRAEARRRGEIL